ncbi:MAG: GIY-YIG nuclease family protein [Chloroflexi bacterium]|nr:GIY-YIG nuclease family protein [Chloroflexota bacterium]
MSDTGNYVLLLHLPTDETLTVGKLGTFDFPAGWYTYVGSAFGSGGLVGRLKHHLKLVEHPHWHIDYLRQVAQLQEIWLSPDTEPHERDWADLMLAIPGATAIVEGFGASDSDRETHLFYFDVRPSLEDFTVGVRMRFAATTVLRAYTNEAENSE